MGMIIQNGNVFTGNAERGYREHTLWDGPATPSISGTLITLNDSISKYDEIVFEIDKGNYDYSGQSRFNVSLLTVGDTYIDTVYTGSYQGAFWTYTSDTSITIKAQSTSSMQTYNRIIGIKYSEVVAGTSFHKYSTTERVVGEWIDGSTVYEKTLKIEPVALSNGTTIAHGISNLGIVVSSDMVMHRSNGEFVLPYTSNYNKTSNFIITSTDLAFVSSDTWSASDYINLYVTLRYTKSSS